MRARVLVTTRRGGHSVPPYDENNLAWHVGDDPEAIAANRRGLAELVGVDRVQFMRQVHGASVAVVERASDDDIADVDALVTTTRGLAIAVLVADCVPIALVSRNAIAVVHAGRNGVVDGVVGAAVSAVRSLDAGPVAATVGAAVCGRCYEVPVEMQAAVIVKVPAAESTTSWGTPALDLPAAVRRQLADAGVDVTNETAPCTREDDRYYSHRRDGVTGRFAMVAMLEP